MNQAKTRKGDKTVLPDSIDAMPEFPGGQATLFTFLRKNIKYPVLAEEAGVQGRVIVTFVVDVDGDSLLAHYARFFVVVEEPQGDMLPCGGIGGGAYHVVGFARLAVLVFGADAPHIDLHEAVQLLIAVLATRGEDGSGQQTEKQQYLLKH